MGNDLGDFLGEHLRDKEDMKKQFKTGSTLNYFKVFSDTADVTDIVVVKYRSSEDAFILDDATRGVLGTNKLWGSDESAGSWIFHASGS